MFTALASLFSNRPVRSDVAMTGEITLRGLVLPIGGLKEKSLAAMRAGISTVIIPKLNEKDLVDVPEEAKQKLKFVPVENVDEVLAVALEKDGAVLRFTEHSGGLTRQKISDRETCKALHEMRSVDGNVRSSTDLTLARGSLHRFVRPFSNRRVFTEMVLTVRDAKFA